MPRLNDLERFKSDLDALSHEEQVLARWGEEREYPSPPAVEAGPGTKAAPAKPAAQPARQAPRKAPREEPPAGIEEGLPPDFASLLADLPLDTGEEPGAGARETETPQASGFDLEGLEDLAGLGLGDAPPTAEAPGFGEGDFDLASFAGEGAPVEETSESPAWEETASPEPMEGLVDQEERGEVLPGLESPDFAMPDFGLEEIAGAEDAQATEPTAGAGSTADLESFDLASFGEPEEPSSPEAAESGDFDAFEASGPAETEVAGEGEATELGSMPDLGAEPDFGAGGTASFDMPASLEDFGFGESPTATAETGAEEAAPEDDSGEDLLPALGGLEDAGGMPTESGPSAAPAGFEDFAIPDFGEGPSTSASASPAPESSFETPSGPSPVDSFSMPELGGFGQEGADAFESFSLDTGGIGDAGIGGDLDSALAALGDEIAPASTFNIEKDWGAGFEVPGGAAEIQARERRPSAERQPAAVEEKIRPVSLTEDQVDRLQDRLLSFPLNLRLAVEEAIANEQGSEAQRSKLVWGLVEGKPFDEMATLVSRVLKRRVTIPEGYEKSSGAAFQAEQGSFRFVLKKTVLPILRIAALVLVAASILGYLGWRFVYKPLAADSLYRSGYAAIAKDRYAEAESAFRRATELREFVVWYYRYAEAYAARRQFGLAAARYEELLRLHPAEYKGALDWAQLERGQLKYAEAERILRDYVLWVDYGNKDAILLAGDIYMDWAEEDPAHYEDARASYATLIQKFGMLDPYLARMLVYFMRVDNLKEVLPLKEHFMATGGAALDAPTLAELGGYLLDKDRLDEVHPILQAAVGRDKTLPEAHYQLARYLKRANSPAEELKALDNALLTFRQLPSLGPRREGMYIDTLVRRADAQFGAREYIGAEADYAAAAAEYDKAVALGRVKRSAAFAAAYAGIGQVAYWQRDDLASALTWFERAAADGFDNADLRYQRGYILYRQGRAKDALEQFYVAGKEGPESPYLLFSFGNALYARGDWLAAEGYFRRTVSSMLKALDEINYPLPGEKASHAEIAELLMEAQNNLGAALYQAGARSGDARKRAQAINAFTESTRLYDTLMRDQAALARAGQENLGLTNVNILLKPIRGARPLVFGELERGMAFPRK